MGDKYSDFVNSGFGAVLARRVGLPQIPVLRRYEDGQEPLPGPAIVSGADALRELVGSLGVQVLPDDAQPAPGTRLGGLLFDARAVAAPADLAGLRDFFAGRLRALGGNGRVLVLGLPADGRDVTVDATRQALDGIVRSLAKELRGGATANLLWVQDDASLESALRFFLSGRSAYVDGQPLLLGAGPVAAPADWNAPLAGRTALVTGAARGIGAAIAQVLARDGAHVILADLPQAGEALAGVANRISGRSAGDGGTGGATALHLDVAAADAPERLLGYLAERGIGLDVLVHNAGITRDKLLANMKPEQWDAVIAVNLQSQLTINAALLASGTALNKGARVVTLSSTTGFSGNRGQTNYGATKAGVIGLVRSSAPAFAAAGATINGIAPGFIDTEMTAKMPFATREVARRLCSLQQAGLPVDIAEAVSFLAWPSSGGINGQVLRVCGQNLVGA